jgi:peptidoglycan glycosyltransferase/penicillin-binding protein 2
MCFFLFLFLSLAGAVGYYQLIKGPDLAREAASMRNQQIEIKEWSRGEIYDRNHLLLTGSTTSTALYCLPRDIKVDGTMPADESERISTAAKILAGCLSISGLSSEDIQSELEQANADGRGIVRLAANLEPEEIQAVGDSGLTGVIPAPLLKRYREDGFGVHLLGYVGKGDGLGKAGLEKLYDEVLAGSDSGQEIVSVKDARGTTIQGLMFRMRQEQEKEKSCLVLTIDSRVQEVIEQAMNERMAQGAVVVLDVNSKEVLAMASRPSFNPYADIEQLIKNDGQSILTNRALSRYHPGSIFKILVAAAALEEEAVKWEDQFFCSGSYYFSEEVSISCWKEGGHGKLSFPEAFTNSCNPSFIEIARKLNRNRLMEYVEKFHLTDETLRGYNSDRDYSYVRIEPGGPALANACLGQQGVMLTPLEIASMIATIADNGQWAPPSVIRYWINDEGSKTSLAPLAKEQVISEQTARMVQELMKQTVIQGTGKNAALELVQVAGKTATAQEGKEISDEGEREILNTWFAGFFPADNPRWAIVVLAEDGTSGAADAAPIFKTIAESILTLLL